jgi:hypothetical protein
MDTNAIDLGLSDGLRRRSKRGRGSNAACSHLPHLAGARLPRSASRIPRL